MNISQDHTILYRFSDWQQEKELMMSVRYPVFVVEQRVPPDIEIDALDPVCIHVIATASDDQPVGTARMADNGHIGRCAILKQWREKGIGTRLVTMLTEKAAEAGLKTVHLNSQMSAVPFYEKIGFVPYGLEFIEADIIHIPMEKILP